MARLLYAGEHDLVEPLGRRGLEILANLVARGRSRPSALAAKMSVDESTVREGTRELARRGYAQYFSLQSDELADDNGVRQNEALIRSSPSGEAVWWAFFDANLARGGIKAYERLFALDNLRDFGKLLAAAIVLCADDDGFDDRAAVGLEALALSDAVRRKKALLAIGNESSEMTGPREPERPARPAPRSRRIGARSG
jgi:hypothetical protein